MEQGAQRALLLYSCGPSDSSDLQNFGNPSSIHWAGRKAKSAVDRARDSLAALLGVDDPDSLCFTGSATEAINTALKGFFFFHRSANRVVRIITSAVEHEATLETARFLAELGAMVEILAVNEQGELSLSDLEKRLQAASKQEAVLVSLMAANNETGVVFPWEEAARLAKSYNAFFHLDGVQAPGKVPGFRLTEHVHLASFSAHKIGGAKGVGALFIRKGVNLQSLLHGGAQERKRRAGTVNVPGIAAFGEAAEAVGKRDLGALDRMRAELEAKVKELISGTRVQGAGAKRMVNTCNFLFDGVRGESLLMALDLEGFAVSAGSACNSGSILPSHVLLAMGLDKAAAQSAIRVSLGPSNTAQELELFTAALAKAVARIRAQASRS